MCETCNPLCGNCKPPALKAVVCPACGKATLLTREECLLHLGRPHRMTDAERAMAAERPFGAPACASCGASLREALEQRVVPRACSFSGIVCGYPCGQSSATRRPDDAPCAHQVPLGRARSGPRAAEPAVSGD